MTPAEVSSIWESDMYSDIRRSQKYREESKLHKNITYLTTNEGCQLAAFIWVVDPGLVGADAVGGVPAVAAVFEEPAEARGFADIRLGEGGARREARRVRRADNRGAAGTGTGGAGADRGARVRSLNPLDFWH